MNEKPKTADPVHDVIHKFWTPHYHCLSSIINITYVTWKTKQEYIYLSCILIISIVAMLKYESEL